MKPEELVSEERMREIAEKAAEEFGFTSGRAQWAMFAAERAVLEELGIARIAEFNVEDDTAESVARTSVFVSVGNDGAVLVRRKK